MRGKLQIVFSQFCISFCCPLAASIGHFGGGSAVLTLLGYQNALAGRLRSIAGVFKELIPAQPEKNRANKKTPALGRGLFFLLDRMIAS